MENDPDATPPISPFRLRTRRHAEFRLADALQFLLRSPGGEESAIRFNERYDEEMRDLCQSVADEIAETGRYFKRVDAAASAYNARPMYRHDLLMTKKRARRSGAGLWYIYYTIDDTNNDGKPDALTVYSIEHSAAEPFAINTGQFDADTEDDGE